METKQQKLVNLVAKISSLPTLPHVVTKLEKMLENPNVSAEEVNRVISSDQVLTAKILKLVNSAFYGFPGQISTVTHAVVILGFSTVQTIALSTSVFDLFEMESKAGRFDRRRFWEHSIATAVISKLIAQKYLPADPEKAFVAGLIHDIGKVILDQFLHVYLQCIMEEVYKDDILFVDAERRVMECGHDDMGAWLAEKWSLPIALREAIACHHQPAKAKEGKILASIVHLADIFARVKNIGNGGDNHIPYLKQDAWELTTLGESKMQEFYDEIDDAIEKADMFFSMVENK
ncbi:MAG: HDOD domain-containing protein [Candidatus Auribacterota bacterium]|jgi:putative nucleotidyltransferase with HDIG domain|nr:HDOD domain-containing protein [Candidatus Auribacterota bacterium]